MALQIDRLRMTLATGSDKDKIAALKHMREMITDGEPGWLFDVAVELVADPNIDVRWQAIIVIGDYIPSGQRNDDVWNVIVQFCGTDDDMQDSLATVLLEHLLEHDFESTLSRIRSALPERTRFLVEVAKRCWQFGQPETKWQEFRHLIEGRVSAD